MNDAIIAAIKKFFENQNWKYDYFEEEGMFQSAVALTEETGVMIHAIVGQNAFTVMVAAELNTDAEAYHEIRAFINDVNARLLLGGLVLDCDEGILYFRVGQNCMNQTPNESIVEDAFLYPITFMDENFETLAGIMQGDLSAQQALEQLFAEEA